MGPLLIIKVFYIAHRVLELFFGRAEYHYLFNFIKRAFRLTLILAVIILRVRVSNNEIFRLDQ